MAKFNLYRGKVRKPLKLVVYGPEGIGKSTLASKLPGPVFIDTENGSNQLDVARLPRPTSWVMLLDEVAEIRDHGQEYGCKTLIIDTVDAAERLAQDAVLADGQKASIEDFGYGKGYVLVKERFVKMLDLLSECVEAGYNVALLGHAILSKVERPDEQASYDKWGMKLIDTKRVSDAALVKEWADCLLFLDYDVTIVKSSDGKKATATGGKRVVHANHNVTYDAKNRFGLADEMPLDDACAQTIASLCTAGPGTVDTVPSQVVPDVAPEPPGQPLPSAQGTVVAGTEAWPAHMARLSQLMANDAVTVNQLCQAVAQTGTYPIDCDPTNYDLGFVDYMVSRWDNVRTMAKQCPDVPFN